MEERKKKTTSSVDCLDLLINFSPPQPSRVSSPGDCLPRFFPHAAALRLKNAHLSAERVVLRLEGVQSGETTGSFEKGGNRETPVSGGRKKKERKRKEKRRRLPRRKQPWESSLDGPAASVSLVWQCNSIAGRSKERNTSAAMRGRQRMRASIAARIFLTRNKTQRAGFVKARRAAIGNDTGHTLYSCPYPAAPLPLPRNVITAANALRRTHGCCSALRQTRKRREGDERDKERRNEWGAPPSSAI